MLTLFVVDFDGCIGDSATVLSGVKQECPSIPARFGDVIDALKGYYISHEVPAADVRVHSVCRQRCTLAMLAVHSDLAG